MTELLAILGLLAVITLVIWLTPKIELGHSRAFKVRRVMNWVPIGLTYAFLYMGRYNLKVSQHALEEMPDAMGRPMMGSAHFATIFGIGTAVYGCSFLINGPLTDRMGGKRAIMVSAIGAALANLVLGACTFGLTNHGPFYPELASHFVPIASIVYGVNMYFQSFGAAAIVKCNAPWFHVRERGVIGAVFGILISLGIYFAYDWSGFILAHAGLAPVFVAPAILLLTLCVVVAVLAKDTPGQAGYQDFDTGDASSGETGPRLGVVKVFLLMLRNPIIMTIAVIEFCSGFLRQSIMQWFPTFAKHTDGALHLRSGFVNSHWGLLLCMAGILGGTIAGLISDHVFQSRRAPVASVLYGCVLAGAGAMVFFYRSDAVGWIVIFMSMAVIGVHGVLSGTASMDFGGRNNVGVAVAIIDGFVYGGTAFMSLVYAFILPEEHLDAAGHVVGPCTDPANWSLWPVAMIPMAIIGLSLALRLWNAKPGPKQAARVEAEPAASARAAE